MRRHVCRNTRNAELPPAGYEKETIFEIDVSNKGRDGERAMSRCGLGCVFGYDPRSP